MKLFAALAAAGATALGGAYAVPADAHQGQQDQPRQQKQKQERQQGQARAGGLLTDVTGTLEQQALDNGVPGSYWITDNGTRYAVSAGDDGLLAPYIDQRVTVTGSQPGTKADSGPARLSARLVRPHARGPGVPRRGMTTLSYAVQTKGDVPENTVFYGLFGLPGPDPQSEVPPIDKLGAVALHDYDDDGVYTAKVSLERGQRLLAQIAKGTSQRGPTEVIHPQSIVQSDNTITLDGNESVSTEYAPTNSQTRNCTGVRFEGGDMYNLRATGVDCSTARSVGKDVPGNLGVSYTSHGFTCDGQAAKGPRSFNYRCGKGPDGQKASIAFTAKGAFTCGQVGFEPNTDHGAFDIRSTGVRCDLARSIAADAEGQIPGEYRSHGFKCASQGTGNELNSYYYNCAKDAAQVSFTAS